MSHNIFFFFENRDVYEIMRKNIVQPGRPQMTMWSMRIARWIPKSINTHSEYVTVFPLQQRLQERALVLRYMHITCLVTFHETSEIRKKTYNTEVVVVEPSQGSANRPVVYSWYHAFCYRLPVL
jgi:hypothetical protein